jgi:hypothetical protein
MSTGEPVALLPERERAQERPVREHALLDHPPVARRVQGRAVEDDRRRVEPEVVEDRLRGEGRAARRDEDDDALGHRGADRLAVPRVHRAALVEERPVEVEDQRVVGAGHAGCDSRRGSRAG